MKYTPSFKKYITNEITNLGLKTQEKRNSIILFFGLNLISILLLILLGLNVIHFNTSLIQMIFDALLILLFFLSILIPVLWRFLYDGIFIKLKGKYHILILPDYKIRRREREESKLVMIYMISNKLTFNIKKSKRELYSKISNSRWLPRRLNFMFYRLKIKTVLRFYEFSTPINFQKKLLNICLALQEWDTQNN